MLREIKSHEMPAILDVRESLVEQLDFGSEYMGNAYTCVNVIWNGILSRQQLLLVRIGCMQIYNLSSIHMSCYKN